MENDENIDLRDLRPSDEMAQAIGHVIVAAAEAEDALAHIVAEWERRDPIVRENPRGCRLWSDSGRTLADALETAYEGKFDGIAKEYRELSARRNDLVHGVVVFPGTVREFRVRRARAAEQRERAEMQPGADVWFHKKVSSFDLESLVEMERRFWALSRDADAALVSVGFYVKESAES